MQEFSYSEVAQLIDHALLTPNLTADELESGIRLARAFEVASVCILPHYLGECVERLAGSVVRPSTTIGFPHGALPTRVKRVEAEQAVEAGCRELDMVVNISQVLSGNWAAVQSDIAAVIEVAHAAGRKVKVIFENCYLKDDHKLRLCRICTELGADWVKTSTGFGSGGATLDDVRLMREHSGPQVQIKAAGGIRDLDSLLAFRALGATRCGASATAAILSTARDRLGLPPIDVPQAGLGPAGY